MKNMSESELSQFDYLSMIRDTSFEASSKNANLLGDVYTAYRTSDALANRVEFWKWIGRNYQKYVDEGILESSNNYFTYNAASKVVNGREEAVKKVIQGKGYEWDWMSEQRHSLQNLFKQYDAGDVANRAASDITERNLITGSSKEYQMKAYLSRNNPDLHNTPKDMTVVTNAEKVNVVKQNGYQNVESYKDASTIQKDVDRRMRDLKTGNAVPHYNVKNVATTMGKSGLIGFAIGVTTETIIDYKLWKNGDISGTDYLKRVAASGGNAGITAAVTSGIMIPVEAAVTAAGISCPVTIPIAIVIGATVDKFVAPCFGRGDYQKILGKAVYYQNLEYLYRDMAEAIDKSNQMYYSFVLEMNQQQLDFARIDTRNKLADDKLKSLKDIL